MILFLRFLERYLGYERDPLVLALTAYALTMVGSTKSKVAVKMLSSLERTSSELKLDFLILD